MSAPNLFLSTQSDPSIWRAHHKRIRAQTFQTPLHLREQNERDSHSNCATASGSRSRNECESHGDIDVEGTIEVENLEEESISWEEQHTMIVDELIDTELQYTNSLIYLCDNYISPMRQWPESLGTTHEELDELFSNIHIIMKFHLDFILPGLQSRDITTTFLENCQAMNIYTDYVSTYDKKLDILSNLTKNNKFNDFLSKAPKFNHDSGLMSLMIKPVQRLPRYMLLLQNILKVIPDTHPDFPGLKMAHEAIAGVAGHINEAKRRIESVSKLIHIQQRIQDSCGIICIPQRSFVREDIFTQKMESHLFDKKIRKVILFNDMIIWTTQHDKFKGKRPLVGLLIRQIFNHHKKPKIGDEDERKSHQDYVELVQDNMDTVFFTDEDTEKLKDWVKAAKKCQSQLTYLRTSQRNKINETIENRQHQQTPKTPHRRLRSDGDMVAFGSLGSRGRAIYAPAPVFKTRESIHEGWLMKKGVGIVRAKWVHYYFVLSAKQFSFFLNDHQEDALAFGFMDTRRIQFVVKRSSVRFDVTASVPFSRKLIKYKLKSLGSDDAHAWIKKLQKVQKDTSQKVSASCSPTPTPDRRRLPELQLQHQSSGENIDFNNFAITRNRSRSQQPRIRPDIDN